MHPPHTKLAPGSYDLLHNFLGHGHQHPPLFHIQGHQTSDYIPAVKLILNKISVATNIFWELNLKLIAKTSQGWPGWRLCRRFSRDKALRMRGLEAVFRASWPGE